MTSIQERIENIKQVAKRKPFVTNWEEKSRDYQTFDLNSEANTKFLLREYLEEAGFVNTTSEFEYKNGNRIDVACAVFPDETTHYERSYIIGFECKTFEAIDNIDGRIKNQLTDYIESKQFDYLYLVLMREVIDPSLLNVVKSKLKEILGQRYHPQVGVIIISYNGNVCISHGNEIFTNDRNKTSKTSFSTQYKYKCKKVQSCNPSREEDVQYETWKFLRKSYIAWAEPKLTDRKIHREGFTYGPNKEYSIPNDPRSFIGRKLRKEIHGGYENYDEGHFKPDFGFINEKGERMLVECKLLRNKENIDFNQLESYSKTAQYTELLIAFETSSWKRSQEREKETLTGWQDGKEIEIFHTGECITILKYSEFKKFLNFY